MTVALDGDRLIEWQAEMVALERFGIKVRVKTDMSGPPKGSHVWLQVGSPDEAFMPVRGMVWRVDSDGVIAVLVSLSDGEFVRLRGCVSAGPRPRPAPVQPVRPPSDSPAHEAETIREKNTEKERERAFLALIHEGRRMLPSRGEVAEKISEIRTRGDKEKGKRSKRG